MSDVLERGVTITGTKEALQTWVKRRYPEIVTVMAQVDQDVPYLKRQISPYQGALLYWLFRPSWGQHILEIGTAWGYSAAILAWAAGPWGQVTTLNPKGHEVERAREHLADYETVSIIQTRSDEYWAQSDGAEYGGLFVDGDHEHVSRDFPYLNRVKVGHPIVFHDYSPEGSWRPCGSVYDQINDDLAARLGRLPDLVIEEPDHTGLAIYYRREGDQA